MPTFTEILDQMGVAWRRGSKHSEVNLCCPFCVDRGETADDRFRLGVNVVWDSCHCFNCEYKSRIQSQLRVLRQLGVKVTEAETSSIGEEEKIPPPELPRDFMPLTKIARDKDPLLQKAVRYVVDRGITWEQIARNNIGVSLVGRFAYRVIFPVMYKDELKGVVARDFTGKQSPKYLNSKGPKFLYNLRPPGKSKKLILSEGIIKALAIERAVKLRSAALLGHTVTSGMLEAIRAEGYKSVVVWPDPDSPGVRGAVAVANDCSSANLHTWVIYPIPRAQADEMTENELWQAVHFAQKKWDWKLSSKLSVSLAF